MDKWAELNDFSAFEGTLPCVLCKADSSMTVVGNHWKCSACAHVFNKDGLELKVQCYCETCVKKNQAPQVDLDDALKRLNTLEKQPQIPKRKSRSKKK